MLMLMSRLLVAVTLLQALVVTTSLSEVSVGDDGTLRDANDMTGMSFTNQLDRTVDLYWDAGPGSEAKMATILPRKSTRLNTFAGHRFFFCEHNRGRG